MNIEQHLKTRYMNTNLHNVWIDEDEGLATFPLSDGTSYNPQIIGYVQYRPGATKVKRNDPKTGKYYTYVPKGRAGVWGTESFVFRNSKVVFVTEGVFDACRFTNFMSPAVAVLSNNPKHLKNYLSFLSSQVQTVAICDSGKAGKSLAKYTIHAVFLNEDENGNDVDAGDLTDEEILKIINEFA